MTNTRAVNEVRDLQCMQPWGDEQYELATRHAKELDTLREVWEAVFDPDKQRIHKDMRGLRNTISVLESQLATLRAERDELFAQRDKLLAALEHYMSGHPCSGGDSDNNRCPSVVEARAAIARCKA